MEPNLYHLIRKMRKEVAPCLIFLKEGEKMQLQAEHLGKSGK